MLTIRLSRIGKKKKPFYRVIISEKSKDPYGKALEILGSYNPFTKDLKVDEDRVNYWLSKGAGMSPTANNLLIEKKVIKGDKIKASKPGKKAEEEKKAEEKKAPTEEKPVEEEKKAEPKEERSEEKPVEETK